MLKIKIVERYKTSTKIIDLLSSVPNMDLIVTDGYAQIIEKTNISYCL